MRPIDADELIEHAWRDRLNSRELIVEMIEKAPPVQVIPIPNNATNGDMIKAIVGANKVYSFVHDVQIRDELDNWFNECVVAQFDKEWWNLPYKGSDVE